MAPPVAKTLQCSYCSKQFGRTEHLKRHELIHTNGRVFSCVECGKGFQRRDALNRHELTHKTSSPSLLSKGARACSGCAVAKTRCSGEQPCSRCQQREVQCVYPEADVEQQSPTRNVQDQHSGMHAVAVDQTMIDFQSALHSLPSENSLPFGPSSPTFDSDFWDPTILSTTNWLDAVIDDGFQGLHFDFDINNGAVEQSTSPTQTNNDVRTWNAPSQPGLTPAAASIPSPAVASNASALSRVSTETAADISVSQEGSTRSIGEYYVDGEPARLPRTKRRKLSSTQPAPRSYSLEDLTFSVRLLLPQDVDLKHKLHIPDTIYEQLASMYNQTCVDTQLPWPSFEATEFPPKNIFEHLLGLYFAHFHQCLPFMHPPSFRVEDTDPTLLVAMAGVGARFFAAGSPTFATSLSEIARRSLLLINEDLSRPFPNTLTVGQVQLLLSVAFVYSVDKQTITRGFEMHHNLVSAFGHLVREVTDFMRTHSEPTEVEWKDWIRQEQVVRLSYSIWLLDCMWSYQFQRHAILALRDAVLPLPCHEKHWRAGTAEEWENLKSTRTVLPTLKDALQALYIDKRLPRDRGEFARVIMIHGLFQRTWEVEIYFSNPLSHWEPTAERQSSANALPPEPVSLLSLPTYTKWQNSVCDCIDILHWQANATIGQASGLEHPTVAFLHLSRVVLLSPINTIVRYAKATIGGSSDMDVDKKLIRQWANQGQYKARLAAIHAGVVFWHIRRYSIDAFYEAPAVALAALMLWAFGKYAPTKTSKNGSGSRGGTLATIRHAENLRESPAESSDDSACDIILLDRPADDELVQQFIRRGHSMHAHITGVGDLYGPQGPQRVLLEGCKLLQSLKCWGVSERWLSVLQQLHRSCLNGAQD